MFRAFTSQITPNSHQLIANSWQIVQIITLKPISKIISRTIALAPPCQRLQTRANRFLYCLRKEVGITNHHTLYTQSRTRAYLGNEVLVLSPKRIRVWIKPLQVFNRLLYRPIQFKLAICFTNWTITPKVTSVATLQIRAFRSNSRSLARAWAHKFLKPQ